MSIYCKLADAVIIRPNPTEIDISSYSLGSSLEVVCHVEAACVLPEVSLWKNNSVIQSMNITNTDRNLQFSLEVTTDLPGTYQYRAVYYLHGLKWIISSSFQLVQTIPEAVWVSAVSQYTFNIPFSSIRL